jgi:hypothetical protein
MKLQFRNWKGELTDAPKDLGIIIFRSEDASIVWSRSGRKHRVRYCLQVNEFTDSIEAAKQVGCCIHHQAECRGIEVSPCNY